MPITMRNVPSVSEGDTDTLAADFTELLDAGETLTGTPTIVEVTTADLTIVSKSINIGELLILNRTVAVGMAVQCKISGQQNNTDDSPKLYRIRITVSTTAGRTFVRDATFYAR